LLVNGLHQITKQNFLLETLIFVTVSIIFRAISGLSDAVIFISWGVLLPSDTLPETTAAVQNARFCSEAGMERIPQ
jgi:hypothetical protein